MFGGGGARGGSDDSKGAGGGGGGGLDLGVNEITRARDEERMLEEAVRSVWGGGRGGRVCMCLHLSSCLLPPPPALLSMCICVWGGK